MVAWSYIVNYCIVAWFYYTLMFYTSLLLQYCSKIVLYITLLYCGVIVYCEFWYYNMNINFLSESATPRAIFALFKMAIKELFFIWNSAKFVQA